MLRIDLVNAVRCPGVRQNVLRFSEYHVQAGGGNDVDVATRLMTHIRNESFECGFPERDKVDFHGSVAWKLQKEKVFGFENPLCFVCRVPCFVQCLADLFKSVPYSTQSCKRSTNFYFGLCVQCYKHIENLYCIVLGINFPDSVSLLFFFSASLNLMCIKSSFLQDRRIAQVWCIKHCTGWKGEGCQSRPSFM